MRKNTAIYHCRLARVSKSVTDIFNKKLNSGGGFIPETPNAEWSFPVVQYPNGKPEVGELTTIVFAREQRKDGKGVRNIVRVYRLPEQVQKNAADRGIYWLRAAIVLAEKISVIDQNWEYLTSDKIQYARNMRFHVSGHDEYRGNEDKKTSYFAAVAISKSKEKVALVAWSEGNKKIVEF